MEQAADRCRRETRGLQDEVNLLKNEVKQRLVDLREFFMKQRTISSRPHWATQAVNNGGQLDAVPPKPDAGRREPGDSDVQAVNSDARDGDAPAKVLGMSAIDRALLSSAVLDAPMLSNLILWLGTVKGRGITLQRVTPYLETYERAGYITPAMTKLMILSMAELDRTEEASSSQAFSSQDYSECLRELHDIVCNLGCIMDQPVVEQSG